MELLKEFLNIELKISDTGKREKLLLYNRLLLEQNKKINLISRNIRSAEDLIINSVFFLKKFKFPEEAKVIDIGTGGGLPGIPLKILYPEMKLTLLDSIGKKVKAVEEIISGLGLTETEAVCGRAEEISADARHNKSYDYAVSKSVAELEKLFRWGKNLIKTGGEILCIKGGNIEGEIGGLIKAMKGFKMNIISYEFPEKYRIEDKKLVIIKR